MFSIGRAKPKVTHDQWVEWARETFECVDFYFDYSVFGKPSNDMVHAVSNAGLPDWAKWRTIKKTDVLPIKKGEKYLEENKDRRMLTLEEIEETENINLSAVQAGLRQAEQMLDKSFRIKEGLDKKALTLLSVFVPSSIVLFSVPRISAIEVDNPAVHWAALMTGLCFSAGALYLFRSLRAMRYGTMGRYPGTWLQRGTLDGDDDKHAHVLAIGLHSYQKRIYASRTSNQRKARYIDTGILLGVASPIVFPSWLLLAYIKDYLFG